MRISVIIPHCPSEKHDILLRECLESLPPVFERIIVVNEINTIGFTKAVNHGLRVAQGDFIMVVNNDVTWDSGSIEDLCLADAVTSPKMNNEPQSFWGCFFVIPRKILDKIGLLDEQFYLYCSDTDFIMRLRQAGIERRCIEVCNILTKGGQTTQHVKGRTEIDNKDMMKFETKWGVSASQANN